MPQAPPILKADCFQNFQDAAFFTLTSSSLKLNCTHIADIYLLLKASTVAQDTLKKDKKNYIFLKQWLEIVPESEFRCFVHDNKLIGIIYFI